MLTRKDMVRCQKMLAYLEIFDSLIERDINNFITNRKESDAAHDLLIEAAKKALDDI
jgi:hypothetical protein